ncbi:hypothetical protein INQ51_02510 [Maribellus sp. CM-23]|uniref:hypothetical protein n=1 Tax=Maribellus sp. CM-23 TaxID=2781026 RepID=UPI001F2AA928|nr:hypothetical protein [Maribellus sp. CM-23]MCE4563172.1 hypothetical protein [Maribellus sp. CM-23]
MTAYETIYEYKFGGSDIWHLIPFLLVGALGFGIVYFVKKYYKRFSVPRQIILFFGWILGIISSIIVVVFLMKIPSIVERERNLKSMIENKAYTKIEGKVEDFNPAQKSQNHFESFSVKGVHFRYSDYLIIDGFHKTSNNNGPIKENGQMVRIGYTNIDGENVILKLEISAQNE